MLSPDLALAATRERQRELIAETDRRRLLAAARRARRAGRRRADTHAEVNTVAGNGPEDSLTPVRTTRGGISPVMIGRDRELRQLMRLASSRHPQVAIISGEPGIGKIRLIQELLATLPAEVVTLVGRAEPGSLARPYEVLLDAVDGLPGTRKRSWRHWSTRRWRNRATTATDRADALYLTRSSPRRTARSLRRWTDLDGYRAVVDSPTLPPSVRGTARVGAARCLLARDRSESAAEHVTEAAMLLARWDGWRVAQLDLVKD